MHTVTKVFRDTWAILVLVLATSIISPTGPAAAAPDRPPGVSANLSVFFRNIETGLCLDSNGTQIYTHVCNGGDWQRWDITYRGTYIEVRNRRTALCLDSNGVQIYPHVCNGGDWQRWDDQPNLPPTPNVHVHRVSGLCLDSNYAGQVYPHICNGGLFQRWQAI
ncbi:RICIN domain-containing protein [Allorhizocola rhizosphaerae]|uniref:RICIN domain-containing protein n=1 Tax=Allorhizocola rhizosphaerae TaxID=1872709 RepID=UPI000E3D407C|nr:RICIN domain-containing protein [Allorhizocola rhizosphaerae]